MPHSLIYHSKGAAALLITLAVFLFTNQAVAVTNTSSVDLEKNSSQYASIADGSQTGLDLTNDFTIEAWFKLEQLPEATPMTIVAKAPVDNSGGYHLMMGPNSTNKLHVYYWDSSGNDTQIQSASDFVNSDNIGKWIHVAVSVDVSAKTASMYKNGIAVSTSQFTSGASSVDGGTKSVSIGAVNVDTTPAWFFDGLLDEVRIWSDIRTSSEIEDNMYENVASSSANLVGYWKLENNYQDETSNHNDLTAANSPEFSEEPAHHITCSGIVGFSLVCSILGLF